MKYNNIYNCIICIDKFCKIKYGKEDILHCGHRYYSLCLRKWEIKQFNDINHIHIINVLYVDKNIIEHKNISIFIQFTTFEMIYDIHICMIK